MADELSILIRWSASKGGIDDREVISGTSDIAGTQRLHNIQSVGTSEEALLLGDVAAGGYLVAINRDATNFVEIRPNTGVADLVRLEAGDFCCFRVTDDAAPYVIADTAACDLEYWIYDA